MSLTIPPCGPIRLRVTVQRHGVPDVKLAWSCKPGPYDTVSKLLEQINKAIPLESGEWGLEDYAVELVSQDGSTFEFLHYQAVSDVLKDDDQILIRCLLGDELRRRRLNGRHQISSDGRHLVDGVVFGRPWLRSPTHRPSISLPPRKRIRSGSPDEDDMDDEAMIDANDEDESQKLILGPGHVEDDNDPEDESYDDSSTSSEESSDESEEEENECQDAQKRQVTEQTQDNVDDSMPSTRTRSQRAASLNKPKAVRLELPAATIDKDNTTPIPQRSVSQPLANVKSQKLIGGSNKFAKNKVSGPSNHGQAKPGSRVTLIDMNETEESTDSETDETTDSFDSSSESDESDEDDTEEGRPHMKFFSSDEESSSDETSSDQTSSNETSSDDGESSSDADTIDTSQPRNERTKGNDSSSSKGTSHTRANADSNGDLLGRSGRGKNSDLKNGCEGDKLRDSARHNSTLVRSGSVTWDSREETIAPGTGLPRTQKRNRRRRMRALERSIKEGLFLKQGKSLGLDGGSPGCSIISAAAESGMVVEKVVCEQDANVQEAIMEQQPEQDIFRPGPVRENSGTRNKDARANFDYSAVECYVENVELTTPPFPFEQRWDPQHRKTSWNGRKRGWVNDPPSDKSGPNQNTDQPDVEVNKRRRIQQTEALEEQVGPEAEPPTQSPDLPPVPSTLETLPVIKPQCGLEGKVLTWRLLMLSKRTQWQPQYVQQTGLVLPGGDDKTLVVRLAMRDRDNITHEYDATTGERIYDMLEITCGDESDEADDGLRSLSWDEVVEPRILLQ